MGAWQSKGLAEWVQDGTAYLSVVFSWQLQDAYARAVWHRSAGRQVRAGGPAVALNPDFLEGVAELGGELDALPRHNPEATLTSRGCIRRCPFCAVPRLEGELRELEDWEPRRIVCDNNLLACSKAHFDRVIDRLKPLQGVDFNQGLDARLLTKHHAERLAELDTARIRLALDHTREEGRFLRAYERLRGAGIGKRAIQVYVLIGFDDTPEDALYRLELVRSLGSRPNAMRYQPLDARWRNEYIAPAWTEAELGRYMKYWNRLRWYGQIAFAEWRAKHEA